MVYKTIIFDFDGVLCNDHFYTNLKTSHPKVHKFINTKIFVEGCDIPDKWMRAELTSDDVNRFISDNTGIDFKKLSKLFIESVFAVRVDNRLLNLAKTIISRGDKVALVTNNMAEFTTIIIKNHNLDKIFPVIVNSSDYGLLKRDDNGRLFDIVLKKLGVENYNGVLLIDDSSEARAIFENNGGETFIYENYDQFKPWMKKNLLSTLKISK